MLACGTHGPKERAWGDRGDCGRLQDCLASRSRELVVASPGRARGEQRYSAEGLCRFAQNCLADDSGLLFRETARHARGGEG